MRRDCHFSRKLLLLASVLTACVATAQPSQDSARERRVWYIQAGASGNGLAQSSPFGSPEQIEQASQPGDILFLLPAAVPLDGGLNLKSGQALLGVRSESGAYPVLTNRSQERNGGHGVILADRSRVEGIAIRDALGSGIYGENVSGAEITDVVINNANTGRLGTARELLGTPIPQGGIWFLAAGQGREVNLEVHQTRVLDTAEMGIGVLVEDGAKSTVLVLDSEVLGDQAVEGRNWGISGLAVGASSSLNIEVIRSSVSGRRGRGARNILLSPSLGAKVSGLIHQSYVGESGQDGVIAAPILLPAEIDLEIVESTIENAAQSNVEGTMLALPQNDESAAVASLVNIAISRSTIRRAGQRPGFEGEERNVVMTGSPVGGPASDSPNPEELFQRLRGRYRLGITDSVIDSSDSYGLTVGRPRDGKVADPGQYTVFLRGNRFTSNQAGDILIEASDSQVDAQENCWVSADGQEKARVITSGPVANVSDPVPCSR